MMTQFCLAIVICVLVHVIQCEDPKTSLEMVTKSEWGGRTAFEIDYVIIPVKNIVVHHTVTPNCHNKLECSQTLQNIQNFHMEDLEFHDIGYNFLIGGDGRVYEGTGWHKVGAHTIGYNSKSLGIAFIGNFSDKLPNSKQMKAFKNFLAYGVKTGEIDKDYKLFGARQVSATQSPGLRLYRAIQKMQHFVNL
ncbi:unnamed protein product [Brassicogethes aeneus]|uniref:Peptidoglycan-recognition protein n=1 Tax=Brassicogethes aeneus TaxID=1431903 RepID=A0A9P0FGL2_BRAAE|nr:unnamed protein product [Brassicogethes aeneus]